MEILIIGDVFSKLGRASLETNIKRIKQNRTINFIICNAENISHGRGMNEGHYLWLLNQGVNVITLGNHAFNQKSIYNFIDDSKCIVRPYNYVEEKPGKGLITVNYNGLKITVFQMLGSVFMNDEVNNPFIETKKILESLDSDITICDFHAESTSEKVTFGYAFDGKLTCVFGTHTHVQTSDDRILPKGTAYITDVGMTGPRNSSIGVKKEIIIDRYMNDGQQHFEPEDNDDYQFSALILTVDEKKKVCTKIERIFLVN